MSQISHSGGEAEQLTVEEWNVENHHQGQHRFQGFASDYGEALFNFQQYTIAVT